jgi:acylglycerol lipase
MPAPGPIAPTHTTTIAVRGGALHAETFLPAGPPKGTVLVTHGYMEHCGRYRELAHVLVAAGWAALTYDVRGHGQSFGPRGFVERFSDYLDDFTAVHAAARALAPAAPSVLLGHSHGSLITLRALCGDQPPAAAAAIISGPYLALRLQVPKVKLLAARVASKIAPKFGVPEKLRVEDLTGDRGKQAERTADKLCFDAATSRWFTEANAAQAYVEQHADRIRIPTTWLVGGDDPIADPAASRRVAAKVSGADYHEYAGYKHEVFNETERAGVFAEVEKALAAVADAAARRPVSA